MVRRCPGVDKPCGALLRQGQESEYCGACQIKIRDRGMMVTAESDFERRGRTKWYPIPRTDRIVPLKFEKLDVGVIIKVVSKAYGLTEEQLTTRSSKSEIRYPRYITAFLLHREFDMSVQEIATALRCGSYQSAKYALESTISHLDKNSDPDPDLIEAVRLIRTMYGKHD